MDPTLMPLRFHWYAGVGPPFAGVAVNVAVEPAQMVAEGLAVTETAGVSSGLMLTGKLVLVTMTGLAQVAEEVMTTVMASPLLRAASVYAALLVPTLMPFFFHW